MASEGPGNWWQKTPQGLKGRNKTAAHSDAKSRPFRAERILFANMDLGLRALRFTPGCHITGFQPSVVWTFSSHLSKHKQTRHPSFGGWKAAAPEGRSSARKMSKLQGPLALNSTNQTCVRHPSSRGKRFIAP